MLWQLLFAVSVMGACETGTCVVCKQEAGCDWYGFDCLNKTSTQVTTLDIKPTTCSVCQAGNCGECQAQNNCTWFASTVPGVPGKCEESDYTNSFYEAIDVCPTCQLNTNCDDCNEANNGTCGWYTLPGNLNGKCREAAPSFAYTKVPAGSCATGNLCSGVNSCKECRNVTKNNQPACSWYTSESPSFYNSKCDDKTTGIVSSTFYKKEDSCPECAGTSCIDCKAESGCKWFATSFGLGTAFGECKKNATAPFGKTEVTTCPATCNLHSCVACRSNPACAWWASSSTVIDDSCDLKTETLTHPVQNPATSCGACAASRCYECNNLAGCGWYAEKVGFVTFREGCFPTASAPAGRDLVPNSDGECKGVPNGSSEVVVSLGLLAALALFA